ncbi:CBS domain-containing protein [Allosalinactinospora lopnorensis]|uniref:CBS domain-containing protein n=1 Tax=Allosalinactinospora lopnorensis TaxID=1352348 RepID=UPI001F214A43|nr:CBS domain-containing protein [Allosalinactinospora lopnorensis]
MTRDVVSASADADLRDIALLLHSFKVSALPIVDGDNRVLGLVSESDLLLKLAGPRDSEERRLSRTWNRQERAKSAATTARHIMTTPVVTIGPGKSVEQAASLMRQHRVKRLPVIDAEGVLVAFSAGAIWWGCTPGPTPGSMTRSPAAC